MDSSMHPYRSVLYIPGSKERALDKARSLPTDAIIFDLEDAVAPDVKAEARQTLVEALRQGGYGKRSKIAVDGVYNRFRDGDGLKAECEQGRDLGFDGKTLIHPAQVEIANTAFAPTNSEIELAARQIAAYEESRASGQGIAVVDGQIVENLHVVAAQRIQP
jgi:citrate lyase beta subunit